MDTETYAFSADINQLLSLIINAVYSNKEVFLRELVSNASDALNKVRYESLTNPDCLNSNPNLEIKVSFDRNDKVLKIQDSGIGMTKEEMINNLGTIASSGTKKFIESLTSNKDLPLIGQFGVGFYSAYLVADKVTVISKNNNDEQYSWVSHGNGTFSIQGDSSDYGLSRGTLIMLHLKEDMMEYLDERNVENLIKKHNQFIEFPILLEKQKTRQLESVETTEPTEPVTETFMEFEQLNKDKPLWTRNPRDISEDEYGDFYKSLTGDYDTYLDYCHFSVEGQIEFKGLLYIPKRSPSDLFDGGNKNQMIKLYSRKVFITDNCSDLLPDYMKFVRGVIETDDLPLNISRETLQQTKVLKVIGKNLVKKVLEMLNKISNDPDLFRIFYEQYEKCIKMGVNEDTNHRNKLVPLLRYESMNTNGDKISLDDYVENMVEGQPGIYYISGESLKSVVNSPFLEKLKRKGYDVLFMCDPLDEYVTQHVRDYKEKKLFCVTKENVDFNDDSTEKEEFEKNKTEFQSLCDFMKSTLSDEVEKVILSNKLDGYPCVLSTSEFGWTANMQRILKAQAFNRPELNYMMGRKVLEINPNNTIIQKLKNKLDNGELGSEVTDIVYLLYDLTLQTSGFNIENTNKFSSNVLKLIDNSL